MFMNTHLAHQNVNITTELWKLMDDKTFYMHDEHLKVLGFRL